MTFDQWWGNGIGHPVSVGYDCAKTAWDAGVKATLAALDEAAVVNWSYRKEHEGNPKLMLHDIICQEVAIALDPKVSSAAKLLFEKGQASAIAENKAEYNLGVKEERERAWAWIVAQGTIDDTRGRDFYWVEPDDKKDFMDGR